MKNIKFVVAFLVATLLLSCNITEKITINSDGSGKVSYNFNMSKFVETISKMGDKQKESAKALFSESDKDIDSTFHFKDFKAMAITKGDTLTPEQIVMFEKLEKFSVHSVMNKKKGQAFFELYGTFNTVDELNNMDSPTSTLQKTSGKNADAMAGMGGLFNDTKVTTTFKGNLFSRTVVKKEIPVDTAAVEEVDFEYEDTLYAATDTVAYSEDSTYVYEDYADSTSVDVVDDEEYLEEEVVEEPEMSKAEIKKMNKEFKKIGKLSEKAFKDSKYVLEYTFPRRVKNVSVKNYKLSKDKKTIIIAFSIDEYIKSPEKLSFTIELENQ